MQKRDHEAAKFIERESLALPIDYEAPRTETEARLSAIFAEAFDLNRVGANDDFFDLGGDSLLAETLSMAIAERMGRDFPMSLLLDHGSPRKIASLLNSKEGCSSAARDQSPATKPPFFLVHGRFGFVFPTPAFYEALSSGQKVRIFELPGLRGGRAHESVEEIAGAYVEQLTREYPTGPIFLSAFCMGALIAVEMACQLSEKGRPVSRLVLFSPNIPESTVVNRKRAANREPSKTSWRPVAQSEWFVKTSTPLQKSVGFTFWVILCIFALGRLTDGCDNRDFADQRLRYLRELGFRYRLWRERGDRKNLSIAAQAKLLASFLHYRPRPMTSSVTIVDASENSAAIEDENSTWASILPLRQLITVDQLDPEIMQSSAEHAVRIMESIFQSEVDQRRQP